MVNKSKEERKQEVLKLLDNLPEGFRWNNVTGPVMTKNEIVKEIGAGSEIGDSFIDLTDGLVPPGWPNTLGKRYVCLNCWTELLNTKTGDGNVSCCGQAMWVRQPKFIPSAD